MFKLHTVLDNIAGPTYVYQNLTASAMELACSSNKHTPLYTDKPITDVIRNIKVLHDKEVDVLRKVKKEKGDFNDESVSFVLGFSMQFFIADPLVHVTDTAMGKGVVATKNIKRGRAVALYPRHAIAVVNKRNKDLAAYIKTHEFTPEEDYKLFTIHKDSEWGSSSKYDNGMCGHMINASDGPIVGIENCMFYGVANEFITLLVTTCDVNKGDQLLVNYGPLYKW